MADMEVCRVIHPDGVRRHGVQDGDQGDVIDLPPSLARSWDGRKVEILDRDPRTESGEGEEEQAESEEPEVDESESGESEETESEGEQSEEPEEWPKHTGSGWYELPNGEKVQGEEAANEKLEQLREEAE